MIELVGFGGLVTAAAGVVLDNINMIIGGVSVVVVTGIVFTKKNKDSGRYR